MKNKLLKKGVAGVIAASLLSLSACGAAESAPAQTAQAPAPTEEVKTQEADAANPAETVEAGGIDLSKDPDNKVRIGIQPNTFVPVIADLEGYLKNAGIDFEYSVFSNGPPAIEALTAGDIDLIFTGDQPIFSAINNGVDLRIIANYRTSDKDHGLIVRDDANIKSFADLKGKTISTAFGSNAQPLLYEYLEAGGLTESDVEIVNLSQNDSSTSIVNGDIDAFVGGEPWQSAVTKNDGISLFADTTDFRSFVCIISGAASYLESHPNTTAAVLKAFEDSADYVAAHPEESARRTSEYNGTDESAIDGIITLINITNYRGNLDDKQLADLQKAADLSFKNGLLDKEVNVYDHVDLSYLEIAGIRK